MILESKKKNRYNSDTYGDLRTRGKTEVNSGVQEPRNQKPQYLRGGDGNPSSRRSSHSAAFLFSLGPNGLDDVSINHTG